MKKHEFYAKYANTPLGERDVPFKDSHATLNIIYKDMKMHDEAIRTEELAQKNKIELAEQIWSNLNK